MGRRPASWSSERYEYVHCVNTLVLTILTGLGLFLQELAQGLVGQRDLHEPHRFLSELSEYEHLHRLFRLCVVHIYRNIQACAVGSDVQKLMRSLVCIEHDDWDNTLALIQKQGGKPAEGTQKLLSRPIRN